jgi:puromycin-sensitive aminopeptidase
VRTADTRDRLLLTDERTALDVRGDWVVLNDGGHGFYRVRYPTEMVDALIAEAGLQPLERFNLVSDAWATTLAGQSPLRDFVALIRQLADEDDPDVWAAILGPLHLVDRVVPDDDRPAFRTGSLRATLVGALGTLGGDADVHAEAARLHAAYLRDRSAVDPDLVAPIVGILARNGGEGEYTEFLHRHRNPATPQEEVRYLYALAELRHPGLVRRTLDMALTDVRVQNAPFLIGQVMANRVGGRAAWEFVKDQWDAISERFPSKLIPRMLESITALVEPDLAGDVHGFLAEHPLTSGEKLVEQAEERLDVNIAFRQREEPTLGQTFAAS